MEKKKKNYKKILIITACVIVAVVGSVVLCAYNLLDKINHVPLVHESEETENPNIKPTELTPEDLGVSEDIPRYEETG